MITPDKYGTDKVSEDKAKGMGKLDLSYQRWISAPKQCPEKKLKEFEEDFYKNDRIVCPKGRRQEPPRKAIPALLFDSHFCLQIGKEVAPLDGPAEADLVVDNGGDPLHIAFGDLCVLKGGKGSLCGIVLTQLGQPAAIGP